MSGTVVAVYSRVLEPNQDILITEDVTVQITNITLEVTDDEKTASAAGRSILKMQHLEAHPALLQAAAGYPDFDSDSEDDMLDDSEEDEEDEEDEEEDAADMSKVSKTSASSAGKKAAAVNGKAAAEEDDEDDDEDFAEEDDSDDDEDDEEDGFERQEAEVQIASLIPGKIEHLNTNVMLPGGEDFVFHLSGKYKVHLFGHYIVQPTPPQLAESDYSGSDSEYDSEDEELDSDDLADSELEDDEDASDRFMEIEESPKKSSKTELPATTAAAKPISTDDKSKLSKNQLKKLAKKEKDAAPAAAAAAAPAAEAAKPASKSEPKKDKTEAKPASTDAATTTAAKKAPSKKQTLPSGLVLEDNKVGSGPVAKSGQRVSMRYIGRLSNGKIFDQNTKGAPFSFKLGKGEVIKGWDVGIAGMQVGGERRLVIPANLAYGKQGVAGIPPNSTLTFEVKLLSIK